MINYALIKNIGIKQEYIENLFDMYEIPKEIDIYNEDSGKIEKTIVFSESFWLSSKEVSFNALGVQLAELLMFMESNKWGELKLIYTISSPMSAKEKKNIIIKQREFKEDFKCFLFNSIKKYGQYQVEGVDIESLREYIKNGKEIMDMEFKGNAIIGRSLNRVYSFMDEFFLFDGWTKTKIYSFLYDWGVLAGLFYEKEKGFSGEIGAEKFNEVRNRLMAYEKALKSLESLEKKKRKKKK